MLQNSQEAEFINHKFRQKYYKFFKRWRFKPKLQAEILQFFQKGGIYKPGLQAKILQNSKETWVFPYTTYYKKDEPTEDELSKEWKNIRLSVGY